jgi:hypothetical protein
MTATTYTCGEWPLEFGKPHCASTDIMHKGDEGTVR